MAAPVLLYGSESLVNIKPLKSRLQVAEMRFLCRIEGCDRRDQISNEDVRPELNVYNQNEVVEYIR